MSTRAAELAMALVLAAMSAGLMWKSAELPIGWIPGEGPGGGAFPFWLAAGMLGCCAWTVVRWARRATPPSHDGGPFFDPRTRARLALVALALVAMVGLIHVIGVYGAIPLFLLFYLQVLGRHSWKVTAPMVIATPVVAFFFFEVALHITLPKGRTEPLFYPLYEMFM